VLIVALGMLVAFSALLAAAALTQNVMVPYCGIWLVVVLGAIGLVIAARPHRVPSGHCVHCGYCLRGLPEPRCPECGTTFDQRQCMSRNHMDGDEVR
jgi:hypothetical protein